MKIKLFFILTIIYMTMGCNQKKNESPEKWSDAEINEWFSEGTWKQGWDVKPDETVDKKELAIQFFRNKDRWEKAFTFLKEKDLESLEAGSYELDGQNLFVNVNEYTPRNEENTKYEAHLEYVDIQYVVKGEEKIGVSPLKDLVETDPYNSEIDAAFLTAEKDNYRLANSEKFFIFFPNDGHRPGVKTENSTQVKKVVVKVKL